ncbi:MAG: ribbon-helix-helix domain-containing protein [Alphaproteobacteria bacterium]|jgi:predicted DNA-binding ribbon-helix-helix protein|nr:ribbon-helix-helix domain-containing protein [Alphaproteobacteria bacterium]
MMPTVVKKRSVVVAGHRTSVSLERAFWEALRDLSQLQSKTINQLVSEIDVSRDGNLSSAIRVYILGQARAGVLPRPLDGAGTPGDGVAAPEVEQGEAAAPAAG